MVSELGYLLLEHVVINDDLEFCLWDMSRQGGSYQILGCFDILLKQVQYSLQYSTKTKIVLIMKVSTGVNIFMRWVFNFCLFFIFPLMILACEMSNPGGGGFSMTLFFCARVTS